MASKKLDALLSDLHPDRFPTRITVTRTGYMQMQLSCWFRGEKIPVTLPVASSVMVDRLEELTRWLVKRGYIRVGNNTQKIELERGW